MSGDQPGNSMNLPYEPTPVGELLDDHILYSGGVVVMAGVAAAETGPMPALVFRFATPTGEFYPPLVLVQTDEQMAKMRPLILAAVHDAREQAKKSQKGTRP